ncbi:hypothetical protein CTAYLR_000602 [Chrysophaeum taylorii]|uniref:Peptidase C1A papain C-terminal domain-containing protein n=1 Tax=Chrysophaeum taylorii TaxID=2483200 RepID=A0AAD7UHQ7_9STRA|nr:hypothetical protein CTAYLR_000602 [Chrysophaeum taylorii]
MLLLYYAVAAGAAAIHPLREAEIAEIRERTSLWTPGETRFSKFAPGVSKWLNGVKGEWKMEVAIALAAGEIERFESSISVPDSFDSATQWPECEKIINDIRDQSNCGCCWAFAGAEAASDRMCISNGGGEMVPLSAQDVCFNSNRDGCDGGQITTPWTYVRSTGAVSGGQYNNSGPFGSGLCSDFSLPHCHHHGPQGDDPYPDEGDPGCPSESSPDGPTACDSDANETHADFANDKYSFSGLVQAATGETRIMQLIYEGGPVETAFTVYSDFEDYVSGIYEHVSGSYAGGHAVKITGWGVENGTKYWKVANSWNEYWGEDGFFRIKKGTNECGIEDEVTASPATTTWSKAGKPLVDY